MLALVRLLLLLLWYCDLPLELNSPGHDSEEAAVQSNLQPATPKLTIRHAFVPMWQPLDLGDDDQAWRSESS